VLADALQQVNITHHLVRLRSDGKTKAFALGHFLENGASRSKFPFGRLVRICRGTDGDVLAPNRFGGKVAVRERTYVLLDINFRLEFIARNVHEFVCVASVAIMAAKFTAAIRVHREPKWNFIGVAVVQNRSNG